MAVREKRVTIGTPVTIFRRALESGTTCSWTPNSSGLRAFHPRPGALLAPPPGYPRWLHRRDQGGRIPCLVTHRA
jgi:hypothetical protein